jgi:hypothetical protein
VRVAPAADEPAEMGDERWQDGASGRRSILRQAAGTRRVERVLRVGLRRGDGRNADLCDADARHLAESIIVRLSS